MFCNYLFSYKTRYFIAYCMKKNIFFRRNGNHITPSFGDPSVILR